MRSSVRNHILDTLLTEWGVSKTVQIVLLAVAAASITIVIGANTIPNQKNVKGRVEHE